MLDAEAMKRIRQATTTYSYKYQVWFDSEWTKACWKLKNPRRQKHVRSKSKVS
jgi:hypothetical protein